MPIHTCEFYNSLSRILHTVGLLYYQKYLFLNS